MGKTTQAHRAVSGWGGWSRISYTKERSVPHDSMDLDCFHQPLHCRRGCGNETSLQGWGRPAWKTGAQSHVMTPRINRYADTMYNI